jgi:pimeloyl-ACP methyl ester carboxylesterase
VSELVDVAGQHLHVRRQEGRTPTVVLCSALGTVCTDWDAVLALLPDLDVVVFDRPGTGHSPPATPPWPQAAAATLHEEVERVADVAAAVGAVPPYVVVGHSSGGLYAQAFARLHAEHTAGVVLIDTSASQPPPSPAAAALRHRVRTTLARTPLPQLTGAAGRRGLVWAQTVRGRDPLGPAGRRQVYGTREGAHGVLAELDGFDGAAAELAELERSHPFPPVPTTVLTAASTGRPWPRRDRSWIREQQELARSLAADHVVVENAAHLIPLDRPDAVAREIGRTVRAVQDETPWPRGR